MIKKRIAEDLLRVSIADLSRLGLLIPGVNEAVLRWDDREDEIKAVTHMEEDGWGKINFKYTLAATGTEYDVPVLIEPTPCNYGKFRCWFRCCMCYSDADESIKRSFVLYFDGQHFACAKCANVTYRSRLNRFSGVQMSALDVSSFDLRHLTYRGQPTRKLKRIEKQRKKASAVAEQILQAEKKRNQRFNQPRETKDNGN